MNKSNNAKVSVKNNNNSTSEPKSSNVSDFNCYDWRESRSFEIEDESVDLDQDRSMLGDQTLDKIDCMDNELVKSQNDANNTLNLSRGDNDDSIKGDSRLLNHQGDVSNNNIENNVEECQYNESMDIS